jgi:hypothetical protein
MSHTLFGRHSLALAALLAFIHGSAAAAPPAALDRVSVGVGGYFVRPDLNLSVRTQTGSTLSGDVSARQITLPRAHVEFLLGDSQGFALDYYGFSRRYADTLDRPVMVGGVPGAASASGNAEVGLDVGNFAYRWWFGGDTDVFGLGVGFAAYRVRLVANANAATGVGGVTGSASGSYSDEAYAPLLQAGWRHAFNADTRLYLDASGVKKAGSVLSGRIYNVAFGAEWYPLKNLGFAAEYGVTRVKVEDNDKRARLDARLDGPTVFLKARF